MMTPMPTRAAIHAAELRIAQSRQATLDSLRQLPGALRSTLTRPAAIAAIGGGAALSGFWLERQGQCHPAPPPEPQAAGEHTTRNTSMAAVVLAFVMRQAMQNMPLIIHHLRRR